jgi:hypothetical protein
MGETGALIFALVMTTWGLYQRRAKVRTDGVVNTLESERARLEAERSKLETEIKMLSIRPPAMPTFLIQAAPAQAITTTSAPAAPTPTPGDEDGQPFPDERLD